MNLTHLAFAVLLPLWVTQAGNDRSPGVIHFEDGRTLQFDDFLKFRFGPHPGHILLEPRGVYVQSGASSVRIPVAELRQIEVQTYRNATAEGCGRPCGIASVTLAVVTTAGITATVRAGFADHFIVFARNDRWSEPEVQLVPWAKVSPGKPATLNVRRITFGTR